MKRRKFDLYADGLPLLGGIRSLIIVFYIASNFRGQYIMTDAERIGRIKRMLSAVLDISPESVGEDFSSDSAIQWDSLRHLNIIIGLEQEFGVSFPDEDIAQLTSLRLLDITLKNSLASQL